MGMGSAALQPLEKAQTDKIKNAGYEASTKVDFGLGMSDVSSLKSSMHIKRKKINIKIRMAPVVE